ncbi:lymphocyte antigen 6E-like [Rana temporaria]|uniref:lymphocyte antigen 6E-like n=1 Tax=Rana temporaria TaxID=8407 RepID=UPI001AACB022|nr:lymphocyte antigen 6E-like [Rana temporaria]XP_040208074.1 lymphocyte antigen 6E-like [Rana temporaria]
MAAYASFLLLAALCIGTAHSLQCYTCITATSNSNCNTATNCSATQGNCETIVASVSVLGFSTTSITKSCAASCTPTGGSFVVGSTSVSCCSTDLCNTSGAISIKSSYPAIFLAVGTLVMFISGSLL